MISAVDLDSEKFRARILHALAQQNSRLSLQDAVELIIDDTVGNTPEEIDHLVKGLVCDGLVEESFSEIRPGRRGSLLSRVRVEGLSRAQWVGRPLRLEPVVGSSNDAVFELASQGAVPGVAVAAELQTSARGRRGRSFDCKAGLGLWVSILIPAPPAWSDSPRLSLLAALAVARAIEVETGADPQIKWPNDVLLGGKKVAGVLVEAKTMGPRMDIVMGIGIDVHHTAQDFPELFKAQVTSLDAATGVRVERDRLLAHLFESIEQLLEDEKAKQLDLVKEFGARDALAGQRIELKVESGGSLIGTCEGIAEDGGLRLRLTTGEIEVVRAGEIQKKGS